MDETMHTRWFYYQAEHPGQRKCKAFEAWLELEGKEAVKHRQHLMATGYHTNPVTSPKRRNTRASGDKEARKVTSRMDCKGYKKHKVEHTCHVCSGHHNYVRNDGVTGRSTRLTNCKGGYKKTSSQEKARTLKDVRWFTQCTSWEHSASIYVGRDYTSVKHRD